MLLKFFVAERESLRTGMVYQYQFITVNNSFIVVIFCYYLSVFHCHYNSICKTLSNDFCWDVELYKINWIEFILRKVLATHSPLNSWGTHLRWNLAQPKIKSLTILCPNLPKNTQCKPRSWQIIFNIIKTHTFKTTYQIYYLFVVVKW